MLMTLEEPLEAAFMRKRIPPLPAPYTTPSAAAQPVGAGGKYCWLQEPLEGLVHEPLLPHVTYAAPVVPVVSTNATVLPGCVAPTHASHKNPPAVQLCVPAGQALGAGGVGGVTTSTAALHVALYGVPHVPALHVA